MFYGQVLLGLVHCFVRLITLTLVARIEYIPCLCPKWSNVSWGKQRFGRALSFNRVYAHFPSQVQFIESKINVIVAWPWRRRRVGFSLWLTNIFKPYISPPHTFWSIQSSSIFRVHFVSCHGSEREKCTFRTFGDFVRNESITRGGGYSQGYSICFYASQGTNPSLSILQRKVV